MPTLHRFRRTLPPLIVSIALLFGLTSPARAQSAPTMRCPVPASSFVSSFGAPRVGHTHQGVDMMAPDGTPIYAPESGTYRAHGNDSFYLDGESGTQYFGTHLQGHARGDGPVSAGELVAYVGHTGNASADAPHLHLQIATDGSTWEDPFPYMDAACDEASRILTELEFVAQVPLPAFPFSTSAVKVWYDSAHGTDIHGSTAGVLARYFNIVTRRQCEGDAECLNALNRGATEAPSTGDSATSTTSERAATGASPSSSQSGGGLPTSPSNLSDRIPAASTGPDAAARPVGTGSSTSPPTETSPSTLQPTNCGSGQSPTGSRSTTSATTPTPATSVTGVRIGGASNQPTCSPSHRSPTPCEATPRGLSTPARLTAARATPSLSTPQANDDDAGLATPPGAPNADTSAEIHPGNGPAADPYPATFAACSGPPPEVVAAVRYVAEVGAPPTWPYTRIEVQRWYNRTHNPNIGQARAQRLTDYMNAVVEARLRDYLLAIYLSRVAPSSCSGPGDCAAMVRQVFSSRGLDGNAAVRVMMCESGGNPNATNGSFDGLFQQMRSAWGGRSATYGMAGRSIYDGYANAVVSAGMVANDGGWRQWSCKP